MTISIVFPVIYFIYWAFTRFVNKRYVSTSTFILIGFFLPLFLYGLNWSALIDTSTSEEFDFIIISFTILAIIYDFWETHQNKLNFSIVKDIFFSSYGASRLVILNLLFILLYLVESYLGARSFVPALSRIDIHTYSAPIISYITRCPFLFTSLNLLAWSITKKKRYLVWICIILLLPLTRLARMNTAIGLLQTLFLAFAVSNKKKKTAKSRIRTLLVVVLLIVLVSYSIALTNARTNMNLSNANSSANFDYAYSIRYTGPDIPGFAVYYGYFPLSFNNLKINILYNNSVKHNYIGLYSFNSFYFGLLQFDNLLGIRTGTPEAYSLVTAKSATVPTAFWTFYYDYGLLFFIPVIVALILIGFLYKKALSETKSYKYHLLYCFYAPLWIVVSFQNLLFGSTMLVDFALIYLCFGLCFRFKTRNVSVKTHAKCIANRSYRSHI